MRECNSIRIASGPAKRQIFKELKSNAKENSLRNWIKRKKKNVPEMEIELRFEISFSREMVKSE